MTRDPDSIKAWLMAFAFGVGALWCLRRFMTSLARDRFASDTPLAKIRSAPQGYVRLYGQARAASGEPIAAPLSQRPCVWWRYHVEEQQSSGRGSRSWRTIDSACSVELFALNDGDAECLVGPVSADITPTCRDVWYGEDSRPDGPPPRIRPLFPSGTYRYTEQIIDVGAELTVLGELRSHSQMGDDQGALAALLGSWKHDQHALLSRFDTNGDGRIDSDEWDRVRAAAAEQVQRAKLSAPIERTSVIQVPQNGQPFVIAAMKGEDLARRERFRALGYLAAGLLCVVLCALIVMKTRSPL